MNGASPPGIQPTIMTPSAVARGVALVLALGVTAPRSVEAQTESRRSAVSKPFDATANARGAPRRIKQRARSIQRLLRRVRAGRRDHTARCVDAKLHELHAAGRTAADRVRQLDAAKRVGDVRRTLYTLHLLERLDRRSKHLASAARRCETRRLARHRTRTRVRVTVDPRIVRYEGL